MEIFHDKFYYMITSFPLVIHYKTLQFTVSIWRIFKTYDFIN